MFKNICTASRIKRFLKTHRAEYLVFKNRCTASRIKKNFKKHTRLNIFLKKNTQPAEKLERTRSTNDFHSLIFLGFFFSWAGGIRQNGGDKWGMTKKKLEQLYTKDCCLLLCFFRFFIFEEENILTLQECKT